MRAHITFDVDTEKLFDLFRENPNMQASLGASIISTMLAPFDDGFRETVLKEVAGIRVISVNEVVNEKLRQPGDPGRAAIAYDTDKLEGRMIFEAQASHEEQDDTVTICVRTSRVRADGNTILIDKAGGRQSLYATDTDLAMLEYLIAAYRKHPDNPANVISGDTDGKQ